MFLPSLSSVFLLRVQITKESIQHRFKELLNEVIGNAGKIESENERASGCERERERERVREKESERESRER